MSHSSLSQQSSHKQTKITRSELRSKLEKMSSSALLTSLSSPLDPKVRKEVEAELDDRANRGN